MSLIVEDINTADNKEESNKDYNYSYYEYNDNDQILKGRYTKIHDLNNGSYGNITLAKDLQTNKLVAIKYYYTISDNSDSEDSDDQDKHSDQNSNDLYPKGDVNNCLYEYNILKTLHNNITATATKHNTILVDSVINAVDQFDAYLVMDYCSHGDLYDAIRNDTVPRSSKMLFHLINQLTNCLEFIHLNGVYHRDIKPENILIHDITNWQLKLTDFGLATIDATSNEKDIGSERYMAPELFLYDEDELCNLDTDNDEFFSSANNNSSYETDKVDIWALGITFLNIVFHKNPFEIAKPNLDKIFKYYCFNREAVLDIFDIMTPDFYKLIVSCLQLNPSDRNFATLKTYVRSCREFTFDDYIYNTTEDSLYKDVFVEGWDDNSTQIQDNSVSKEISKNNLGSSNKTTTVSSSSSIEIRDSEDKEEPIISYNPININTKHYETAGDVLLRHQKQGGIANSWKAKNLNKLNKFKRNFKDKKYKYYNNNNEGFHLSNHKFSDNNRRNNYFNNNNNSNNTSKNSTSFNNKDNKQVNYYARKPLGIPKPNKHILKYNDNSPNLHYTTTNTLKNSGNHYTNTQRPMSFKSSYNSYSNSFMNSYHPNHSFITKNGITNTHYNKNFNHYMNIQNNFNYNSSSEYSQEEEFDEDDDERGINKNSSNSYEEEDDDEDDDQFDLDSDYKSESFDNNNSNGKFQTAHEYIKVQQSLKKLSESRKKTYKQNNLNSSSSNYNSNNNSNGFLSQNEDDDILFTLEEDQYGMDDSNGTINNFTNPSTNTESFGNIDINRKKQQQKSQSYSKIGSNMNGARKTKHDFEENNGGDNDDNTSLPDLLKPQTAHSNQDEYFNSETNNNLKKQKNVYISPANRRNSNTVGGTIGSLSYNSRRKSHSAGNPIDPNTFMKNSRNVQTSSDIFQFNKKFHRPSFINSLISKPTLSISKNHIDVFSENKEEEEGEEDEDPNSLVVPFSQRNGRKSVNEEIVNMEDYKNNWLSLQLDDE